MNKLLLVIFLVGCSVGRDYKRPEFEMPKNFEADYSNSNKVENINWWKNFNDPVLEELVNLSAAKNLDLEIAKTRILASQANTWELIYDLLPSIDFAGSFNKSQSSQARFPFIPTKEQRQFEYYATSGNVLWEIDLFGRSRRGIEAANAMEDVQSYTLENVLLSVISETAKNYFSFRAAQTKLNLQRKILNNFESILRMAQTELDIGKISKNDFALIDNQYLALRNQYLALDVSKKTFKFNIDNLVNQIPDELNKRMETLEVFPVYKGPVTIGTPAELIERRPDILVAESYVRGANADYGVSIGKLFPDISFVGSLGFESLNSSKLSNSNNIAYNIMPGITWIGTDVLKVSEVIKGADQRYKESVFAYQNTILKALNEVQTVLVDYTTSIEQYQLSTRYSHNLKQLVYTASEEYKLGAGSCKNSMTQDINYLVSRQQTVDAKLALNMKLVTLFKALGGGWFEAKSS